MSKTKHIKSIVVALTAQLLFLFVGIILTSDRGANETLIEYLGSSLHASIGLLIFIKMVVFFFTKRNVK
jgi:hypothetical protein